ncbi:hypothetical protein SAMD00023378_1062 [Ralstonia sp. NT80]|nr:hypothetical protein C404_18545 [Ralstonia sp. AU12-08]GAQ27379.1 hypothetical protein SAMD00023378_1062 [Ralstonia sp. NT80]
MAGAGAKQGAVIADPQNCLSGRSREITADQSEFGQFSSVISGVGGSGGLRHGSGNGKERASPMVPW